MITYYVLVPSARLALPSSLDKWSCNFITTVSVTGTLGFVCAYLPCPCCSGGGDSGNGLPMRLGWSCRHDWRQKQKAWFLLNACLWHMSQGVMPVSHHWYQWLKWQCHVGLNVATVALVTRRTSAMWRPSSTLGGSATRAILFANVSSAKWRIYQRCMLGWRILKWITRMSIGRRLCPAV